MLFIDEIHRLNKMIEEVLYPAMESGVLDIIIGKGPAARYTVEHTAVYSGWSYDKGVSPVCSSTLSNSQAEHIDCNSTHWMN